jgi:hypothetical protein
MSRYQKEPLKILYTCETGGSVVVALEVADCRESAIHTSKFIGAVYIVSEGWIKCKLFSFTNPMFWPAALQKDAIN